MIELARKKKQYTIMAVYAIVFCLLIFGGYLIFVPGPTCFDGKKNLDETDVDCGGSCGKCIVPPVRNALKIDEASYTQTANGRYDVMMKVTNPNDLYGVQSFSYEFSGKDSSGTKRILKQGTSFILPKESKYIVELEIDVPENLTDIAINIAQPEEKNWVIFTEIVAFKFSVLNKKFEIESSGPSYGKVTALVRNDSPFDYGKVVISTILRDSTGKMVALQKTEYGTMKSGELRDYTSTFPDPIAGEVGAIDVYVESDVFNNENFLRRYFPGGRFEEMNTR